MNERIKALAKQAGMEPEDGVVWWVGDGDLEKFAELIVRKCVQKIEIEAAQYAEPVWAVELVNDIHEYFGVEP